MSTAKVSLVGLMRSERSMLWLQAEGTSWQPGVGHWISGIGGYNSGRSVLIPQPLERFVLQIWKTQF